MKISRSDLEKRTCCLRNQTASMLEFEMLDKTFIAPYTCKMQYRLYVSKIAQTGCQNDWFQI